MHVSYKAFQVNKIVNEQSLRELYGQYGEVLDVTIKHATVDKVNQIFISHYIPPKIIWDCKKDGNYQSGYGFIHYSSNETGVSSAFNAVKSLMDTVIDDVNYISKVSHALEKHLTSSGGGGHSSNESISSLDEDSWFELSTVDMNCNEPRQKTSERKQISGHRRISSADTLVNCFQYQQEATGEDYPTEYNIGIAQREEMNDDMEGEMDFDHCGTEANSDNCGGQQLYDMPSTPQRVAYPIMKSPMIVPVQIQPQYLSYQMSPQMVTQQMNSSPMMSPYYYQAQPMYQPIYVASQPPQMPILFPTIQSPYCYSPIAVQQQGNGHIGVTYNQMHQDMAEYSNNYHQSMQPQVYIPVACGYSSPSTMNWDCLYSSNSKVYIELDRVWSMKRGVDRSMDWPNFEFSCCVPYIILDTIFAQ